MSDPKLPPCPFCKHEAEFRDDQPGWVACSNNDCGAWDTLFLPEDWCKCATTDDEKDKS